MANIGETANRMTLVNSTGMEVFLGLSSAPVDTNDVSGAIAAGENVVAAPAVTRRYLIVVSNTGNKPMMLRFGSPATATEGHPIAAGCTAVFDVRCPIEDINLFSVLGTTYSLTLG